MKTILRDISPRAWRLPDELGSRAAIDKLPGIKDLSLWENAEAEISGFEDEYEESWMDARTKEGSKLATRLALGLRSWKG